MKLSRLLWAIKRLRTEFKVTDRILNLFNDKLWHDCIAECNKSLKEDPNYFFGYYYRGLSNFELNFLDDAHSDFKSALSVDLNKIGRKAIKECHNYTNYKIGMILRKQRKYTEAHEHLLKSIASDSKYINHYLLIAELYTDQKNTIEALATLQEGRIANPNNKELEEHQKHLTYNYSVERNEERFGS